VAFNCTKHQTIQAQASSHYTSNGLESSKLLYLNLRNIFMVFFCVERVKGGYTIVIMADSFLGASLKVIR
jgi:hypothetical protein